MESEETFVEAEAALPTERRRGTTKATQKKLATL